MYSTWMAEVASDLNQWNPVTLILGLKQYQRALLFGIQSGMKTRTFFEYIFYNLITNGKPRFIEVYHITP